MGSFFDISWPCPKRKKMVERLFYFLTSAHSVGISPFTTVRNCVDGSKTVSASSPNEAANWSSFILRAGKKVIPRTSGNDGDNNNNSDAHESASLLNFAMLSVVVAVCPIQKLQKQPEKGRYYFVWGDKYGTLCLTIMMYLFGLCLYPQYTVCGNPNTTTAPTHSLVVQETTESG